MRKNILSAKEKQMPVKNSALENNDTTRALINMLGKPGVPDTDVPEYLLTAVAKAKESMKEKASEYTKISIIRDSTLDLPTLCFKIFVQPDPDVGDLEDEARFAKMFAKTGCRRAESVLEADLVIFSGGSDVDPQLYGEKAHEAVYWDPKRDETDIRLYTLCVEYGIPMFGVCRGAQFLSVMNGGKLFQHIDGHNGNHAIIDKRSGSEILKVSSVHHQMVMPNTANGMEILAIARQTKERWANNKNCFIGETEDIEVFFYRDTCCLGVQGHPEYEGYHYFQKYVLDTINECIFENPDLHWTDGGQLRMKKELMDQRGLPFSPISQPLLLTQKVGA